MKKPVWTPLAQEDVDAYSAKIVADNPQAAVDWFEKAGELASNAAEYPEIGRVVPEFGREDIRELFLYSHRLIYRTRKKLVEILRVWPAAMSLKSKHLGIGDEE